MFAEEQGIARLTLEQEEIANFAGIRHSNKRSFKHEKHFYRVFNHCQRDLCNFFNFFDNS